MRLAILWWLSVKLRQDATAWIPDRIRGALFWWTWRTIHKP